MDNFNSKIKQVLLLAIILFLLYMIIGELVIFIPGLLGAVTLYILSRSNYFQLVYNRKWKKGAAAILFEDSARSNELAPALKLRAQDLFDFDLIDGIVPEPQGGAHLDPDGAAQLVREQLVAHLQLLVNAKPKKLVARRAERFRSMGRFEKGWMKIVRNLAYRLRHSLQYQTL